MKTRLSIISLATLPVTQRIQSTLEAGNGAK